MSEQQRSNKLLEEAISLMDQALRLSKTPDALLVEIADRLADRQSFRGMHNSTVALTCLLNSPAGYHKEKNSMVYHDF